MEVKAAIAEEKKKTKERIGAHDQDIDSVRSEMQQMKEKYQQKIKAAREVQDLFLHERVQTQGLLKVFQQKN